MCHICWHFVTNSMLIFFTCGVCFIATFHNNKVHPSFFYFVLVLLSFFFKRGGGVIAFALLSVHKSAMELRSLHRDSESNYFFLFFRVSKLPSIEQCRQKSDKRRYTSPLRQHSWACMVSFSRRRRNKNAHFMHPT